MPESEHVMSHMNNKRFQLTLLICFMLLIAAGVALAGALPLGAAGDPAIVAAGDIACDPTLSTFNGGNGTASNCHMKATASLVLGINPAAALMLGDSQYMSATTSEYSQSYNPSWGQFKGITFPVPGNHEYLTLNAADYFTYYGARAGDPAKGYYSYDIGAWHIIALNVECVNAGGCKAGSPQETWLRADLAAHTGKCTLAYWHEPRWSSGRLGNQSQSDTFWQDLYAAHADVVLSAHDHDYERFAPQTPTQAADPTNGIREFVVGTGGADHGGSAGFPNLQPNSEVRDNTTYGVLKMTLHPTSYDWQFVPDTTSGSFTDSGSQNCHIQSGIPKGPTYSVFLPLLKR